MNKKLISKIAAIVLAVVIVAVAAILIIDNVGTTTISLGSAKALPEDSFQIPIEIDKNHGVWGSQIIIKYDSDNLRFVSCANGEVFDECEANDNVGEIVILTTQTLLEDTSRDGLVATLNFEAKMSADEGDYKISFDEKTEFCNSNEKLVDVEFESGNITIK